MSTIVWCPGCGTGPLMSHAPHGLVPPHTYPTSTAMCTGVGLVGLQVSS